jgi:hypothetical protein
MVSSDLKDPSSQKYFKKVPLDFIVSLIITPLVLLFNNKLNIIINLSQISMK